MRKTLCLLLVLAVLLSGCSLPFSAPAAPEEASAPSAEPTPAPTPTPTPTSTPEPTPTPTPEPTPTPDAHQIALHSELETAAALFDGDFLTYLTFSAGAELSFSADEPVGGVYLVWNTFPGAWELSAAGQTVQAGENGFLHEYVALPAPSAEFTLRLPLDGDMALCDVFAVSEGVLPDWVQVWQPPCEKADILVLPTHADDEYIFFGGVLPEYAVGRGLEVQVLYMTSHYLGSERFRCHEQLNGLWVAGVRHYPVIHMVRDFLFDDMEGAAMYYGHRSFIDYQVQQIRRFQPLVIVEHDINGEYGHAVHCFNAYSMEKAVELAADASYDPDSAAQYGVWDTPKTYLHLYGAPEERTVLNYERPMEAFGGLTAFEVAQKALLEHHSQLLWDFEVYSFDSPYDTHSFGLYRSLVGPDVERSDLMENISVGDWRS